MNTFVKHLCALSGADTKMLQLCPSNEHGRFYWPSIINIGSGMVGSLAAAMAVYFTNTNLHSAFIVGISFLWGFIGFGISAGLLGSIPSMSRNVTSYFVPILAFALRLVITVVFSLFTSQVLTTYIFRDQLALARRQQTLLARWAFDDRMRPMLQEAEALAERLRVAEQELDNWQLRGSNEFFGENYVLAGIMGQLSSLQSQLDSLSMQHRSEDQNSSRGIAEAQTAIIGLTNELNGLDPDDVQRRLDLNSRLIPFNNIIVFEKSEIQRRANERATLQQRITTQQRTVDDHVQRLSFHGEERTRTLEARHQNVVAALAATEANIATERAINEDAIFYTIFSDSLVNRMNSILFLRERRNHADATFEEKATAARILNMQIIFMALILIVDLAAPIIMLFYGSGGEYELRKEAQYKKVKQQCAETEIDWELWEKILGGKTGTPSTS